MSKLPRHVEHRQSKWLQKQNNYWQNPSDLWLRLLNFLVRQRMPQGKKPKSKRLNLNNKKACRDILKDVEKKEVPVHVLERLVVHLKDGTEVNIDVKQILSEGADPDDIERHVQKRLDELEQYIANVDFYVDVDMVEQVVQPETDRILSNL